jgi:hypothetical protein
MGVRRASAVGLLTTLLLAGLLGPAHAARNPIGPTFFGVQDDSATNDDPTWGSARLWAAWCTVQPDPAEDPVEAAERALGAAFATYVRAGTSRLTVSLGHPPPWVFGDHPAAVSRAGSVAWFCGGHRAVTTLPTRTSLRRSALRARYTAYVRGVVVAAQPYLLADPANRLVLQAWNEPNLRNGVTLTRDIPGGVGTWAASARSLQEQERIIRRVARELIPGRFEVTTPSLYGRPTALGSAYFRAQARSRTVDSISLNFYTLRQRTPEASLRQWREKAARAKRIVVRHRPLRRLPIWITETNHNLVNGIPDQSNVTGVWAGPEVQRRLLEVTTMEALRAGFAGIQWYQGSLAQTAVNTRPGTVAAEAGRALRTELEGRSLVAPCRSARRVTTCRLSARTGSGPITVRWSERGSSGLTITPRR